MKLSKDLIIIFLFLIDMSVASNIKNLQSVLNLYDINYEYVIEGLSKIPKQLRLNLLKQGKGKVHMISDFDDDEYLFQFAFSSNKLLQDFTLLTQSINDSEYDKCLFSRSNSMLSIDDSECTHFNKSAQLNDVHHFIQRNQLNWK